MDNKNLEAMDLIVGLSQILEIVLDSYSIYQKI